MARIRHLAALVAVAALPAGVGVAGAATGGSSSPPPAPAPDTAQPTDHPCPNSGGGDPAPASDQGV